MGRIRFVCLLFLLLWSSRVTQAQTSPSYALRGTLVTPSIVVPNGTLVVAGEKIAAVGAVANVPDGVAPIDTGSFIYPGLIDLHNHITWNLFPRWTPANIRDCKCGLDGRKPCGKFGTRYDWQKLGCYTDDLSGPHAALFSEGWACEMDRFGEVKEIAGGATSTVGTLNDPCIKGLARNLDFYSGFYSGTDAEKLSYEVFPLELPVDKASNIRSGLSSGALTAFIVHLSEGNASNASAAREYRMFVAEGFLRPGVSIIHGVALQKDQFQEMAAHGVGLIWSPRSNCELYGTTADMRAAKDAGVVMAIAPDWSPSGSSGMLEEMKYAAASNTCQKAKVFDDSALVKMATIYPAQLAGLSDKIGTLDQDKYADLLLLKRRLTDPYAALTHATPLDVRLVVVDGVPVYGDRDLMEKLLPGQMLQSVKICDKDNAKVLYLGPDASTGVLSNETWKQTEDHLAEALRQWHISLADLAEASECTN